MKHSKHRSLHAIKSVMREADKGILKMKLFGFVMMACMISAGIIVQSCSKEYEPDILDNNSIINSTEFEEYIIAGTDLQQSLAAFTAGLNKIEFSNLEITYEQGWKKVVHFPAGSFGIEEKVQAFNEKKKELFNKFPEFVYLKEETKEKFFGQTIQNSVNVQDKFLKLGITTTPPLLKSGNEVNGDYHFMDNCYLIQFLSWWATPNHSSYLELWVIKYEDGTYATYQHPNAGGNPQSGYYTEMPDWETDSNGNWYFPAGGRSCRVVEVGHTHIWSGVPTPTADYFSVPSSVNRFIYYSGSMYYY